VARDLEKATFSDVPRKRIKLHRKRQEIVESAAILLKGADIEPSAFAEASPFSCAVAALNIGMCF
jgi:hypothetical protein